MKQYKEVLVSSLIALLTVSGMQAQQSLETPSLVVSIVIDQLRGDYLRYFNSTFGEKGFKKLLNEGLVYSSVDFGFPNVGEATSIATIYTGTYPYYHGIVANKKYDFTQNAEISILTDDNYLGNYTSEKLSPLALTASTFGDELKIASQGKSIVYAIAPNAEEAILAGGKYADGAFWLDNYNGKWATSTYYPYVPNYVDHFNMQEAIGIYSEKTWTQGYTYYMGFPYSTRTMPFSYTFGKNDKDRFLKIKQTALINTEITNLAGKFIEQAGLGNPKHPDLLAITYYAGDYKLGETSEEYGYEIQDIYYNLDKELERLFEWIERRIGLKHTLILLSSTGYFDAVNTLSEGFKPMGEFYPNRCTALLNMYLMAIYGQGNWVKAYYNQQIYLNKKLAEEKQIVWTNLVRDAAEFIAQFSGVQEVTTAGQWMVDDAGRAANFRRGMNKKISGDIFIELQSGWVIIHDNHPLKKEYIRNNAILSPFIIWGNGIAKARIDRKIKATEIAPTMAYILRIRPPNGCKETPLPEIIK